MHMSILMKNISCLLLSIFIPIYTSIFIKNIKKKNDIKKNEIQTAVEYIKKYSHIAVKDMEKYGIPASIKLGQAMVESSIGKSILSKKTNNHFGIKCGKYWTGNKYHNNDTYLCFRKYNTVQDSFKDHSNVLRLPRYSKLFSCKKNDYRSWAKELKKLGYATSIGYTKLIIKNIEKYFLWKLDKEVVSNIERRINLHIKLIMRTHNKYKIKKTMEKISFFRKFIFKIFKKKL